MKLSLFVNTSASTHKRNPIQSGKRGSNLKPFEVSVKDFFYLFFFFNFLFYLLSCRDAMTGSVKRSAGCKCNTHQVNWRELESDAERTNLFSYEIAAARKIDRALIPQGAAQRAGTASLDLQVFFHESTNIKTSTIGSDGVTNSVRKPHFCWWQKQRGGKNGELTTMSRKTICYILYPCWRVSIGYNVEGNAPTSPSSSPLSLSLRCASSPACGGIT